LIIRDVEQQAVSRMSYRIDFLLVVTHEGVDISGEFADAR